jgi:hypothetical protein
MPFPVWVNTPHFRYPHAIHAIHSTKGKPLANKFLTLQNNRVHLTHQPTKGTRKMSNFLPGLFLLTPALYFVAEVLARII